MHAFDHTAFDPLAFDTDGSSPIVPAGTPPSAIAELLIPTAIAESPAPSATAVNPTPSGG